MLPLLLALTIAFPKANQSLAYYDECYLIGAVDPGATNIVIQGKDVPVHASGAFATMISLVEGTNTVNVAGSNHVFRVAKKPAPPKPLPPGAEPPKPKPYEKLGYAADEARPHPVGLEPEEITVILDPGHGGKDPGSFSPHNLPEKDANLRMAKAVKKEMEAIGYKVFLTREDDSFVELFERPRLAHEKNAEAFISIHHNAPPPNKNPLEFRYTAVYAWNDIGMELGTAINKAMAEVLEGEVKNNGVPHANYAVTRNPEIPSCLIEVDFLTSPESELSCWDKNRRVMLAKAIAEGFRAWTMKR